jgi:polyhydroxyalkanoate synthesis regulator phasin
MRLRKALIIVGLAGAIVAALVVGTALAQTPTPTPNQAKTNYQNVFLDKLAAALGKSRDQLNQALTQARNDTADQAVKDGNLSQQQADRLKAQSGSAPFGFGFHGFGGPDRGRAPGMMFMGGAQVRDAIAQALGMTPQDLATQLRSGKTLAQLAQGKEQAVKDAITKIVKAQLDQAVKNGRMTQDQENNVLNKIQSMDLNNLGALGGMRKGPGPGNRPKATPAPGNKPSFGPLRPGLGAL